MKRSNRSLLVFKIVFKVYYLVSFQKVSMIGNCVIISVMLDAHDRLD